MFHLDSGVHFHEIEISGLIQKKFYGSGTFVACCFCGAYCCLSHFLSKLMRNGNTWRFFDHFLMTSLDGTVTLSEMNHVSVFVSKNLHLHMSRVLHKPFQIHGVVRKRMNGFLLRCFKQFGKLLLVSRNSHSFSAAACRSLDHHRKSDFFYCFLCFRYRVNRFLCARNYRNFGFSHGVFCLGFISHSGNDFCGWADECHITFLTHFHESAVL